MGEQTGQALFGTLSAACAAGGAAMKRPATNASAVDPIVTIFFTIPPYIFELHLAYRQGWGFLCSRDGQESPFLSQLSEIPVPLPSDIG